MSVLGRPKNNPISNQIIVSESNLLQLNIIACCIFCHCVGVATCLLAQQLDCLGSVGIGRLAEQHDVFSGSGLFLLAQQLACELDSVLSPVVSRPTKTPATMALVIAATGLIIAINGPSNTYDTDTESTPVSGVETKNAVVALFDAPARRSPIAAGITPQEHNGIGAPIHAALTVVQNPSLPRCLFKKLAGK